ncbi:hypothetical protein KIN20_002185 [Parelaphostrongylus tenuis]|uniref:N-acetyl-D-glucosamine kinase n=1 Tax=Parelaphostrongylus tenuis TaxID=148309 RepID=A0AAD5QGK7_PARTN|nr:hypothetical protein KIN20_002185 [Parelaphostrongylus tenuis]
MDGIGANQKHWRGLWPAAKCLAEFLCCNDHVFANSVCLELGSGTGVVGLSLGRLGARKVILTDFPNDEILSLLQENVEKNGLSNVCEVKGLDWQNADSVTAVIDGLTELDYVIASDVFYDVCTFQPLMTVIHAFFQRFPSLQFYFSYAERDDNWSIEDLLLLYNLEGRLVRTRHSDDDSSVQICFPLSTNNVGQNRYSVALKGGASESKLVFVNCAGETIWQSKFDGTNYNLDGIEKTASNIASWVRGAAKKANISLPLKGLGLGLSGAEGARDNARFVNYIETNHGDLAEHISLTSDTVAAIAAAFEHSGIILVAGTGSSCRVLLADGRVFGVGGWGHQIGDGGSGFWIAMRAIRMLFDEDDGLEIPHHSTQMIRNLLLQHFEIEDKVDILEHLYNKFKKSCIASFTKKLAEHTTDPAINGLFHDAGVILGRQFVVAAGHLPSEERAEVNLVLVGSIFLSWNVVKSGFIHAVQGSWIPRVNLYRPKGSSAIGLLCWQQTKVVLTFHIRKMSNTWNLSISISIIIGDIPVVLTIRHFPNIFCC